MGGALSNTTGLISNAPSSTSVATVSGTNSVWTNSSDLTVGNNGTATLNVNDGGMVSSLSGEIGSGSGTGTVTITGTNSLWDTGSLYVGGSDFAPGGTGTLNVNGGGQVDVGGEFKVWNNGTVNLTGSGITANSIDVSLGTLNFTDGILTVDGGSFVNAGPDLIVDSVVPGANPTLVLTNGATANFAGDVHVGSAGGGTLNLLAGSTVTNTRGTIDGESGKTSTVMVSGTNSLWTSLEDLRVGDGGNATLLVSAGGTVATDEGFIGAGGNSVAIATVTGSGSQFNLLSQFMIGDEGDGTLNVETGGTVTSGDGFIGRQADSNGLVTVADAGSSWMSSDSLFVGEDGTGTLTVQNGAEVTNGEGYIGRLSSSIGTATVTGAGSLWTNNATLIVGDAGTGTLNIEAGGVVSNVEGFIGSNANSTGTATMTGAGSEWNSSLNMLVGGLGIGMLNVEAGGVVSNAEGRIGNSGPSTGTANVTGMGSEWNSSGNMIVGRFGNGTLNVEAGGMVSNVDGRVGDRASSTGEATVTGSGSQWNNTGDLTVGDRGIGALNVEAGGMVSNVDAFIGNFAGSSGTVTVTGPGSTWTNSGNLNVGSAAGGTGTLNVNGGGQVDVSGELKVWNNGTVNLTGSGITANSVDVLLGILTFTDGILTVDGGSFVNAGPDLIVDSVVPGANPTLVLTNGATANFAGDVHVGSAGGGTLNLLAGATVTNTRGTIDGESGKTSTVTVSGTNSLWSNLEDLRVGDGGRATLLVSAGGTVATDEGFIGAGGNSVAMVTVTDSGSQFNLLSQFMIGDEGDGTLNVEAGGAVMSGDGFIGRQSGSNGLVTVADAGSMWSSSANVYVGGSDVTSGGTGVLNVNVGGTVDVTNNVTIWNAGTVNLNGGSLNAGAVVMAGSTCNFNSGILNIGNDFQFAAGEALGTSFTITPFHELNVAGTTTIDPISVLTLAGGTFSTGVLAKVGGFVHNSGIFNLTNSDLVLRASGQFGDTLQLASAQQTNVTLNTVIDSDGLLVVDNSALTSTNYTNNGEIVLTKSTAQLKGGNLDNAGLVHGDGRVETTLTNESDGEVRARNGERLVFNGTGNTNVGEINVLDGTVEFSQDLTNEASGFIGGRGVLTADDGLNNQGIIAFTGTSDIFGDADNNAAGRILITGSSTLTFFDDVVHNGAVLRTSAGSTLVFLGGFGGSGTGLVGDFFLEGDLRPGDSPGLLDFDGNVTFGGLNTLEIEIGGLTRVTEYDAVDVSGTLTLGGTLDVVLFDLGGGLFNPQLGDSFNILDAGSIIGSFAGINLPSLQGNLLWDASLLESDGSLSVIPLPPAMWLLLSALVGMVAVGRKSAPAVR